MTMDEASAQESFRQAGQNMIAFAFDSLGACATVAGSTASVTTSMSAASSSASAVVIVDPPNQGVRLQKRKGNPKPSQSVDNAVMCSNCQHVGHNSVSCTTFSRYGNIIRVSKSASLALIEESIVSALVAETVPPASFLFV